MENGIITWPIASIIISIALGIIGAYIRLRAPLHKKSCTQLERCARDFNNLRQDLLQAQNDLTEHEKIMVRLEGNHNTLKIEIANIKNSIADIKTELIGIRGLIIDLFQKKGNKSNK